MRSDLYQYALIFLGIVVTSLFGVFLYREIFPEYKIYQNDYIALEEFRSTYSGSPPPDFSTGIQQIVLERSDKGPPRIDRCTSCHVTLKFSHFSPTRIAKDLNGNILLDEQGFPIKIPNEDYVWGKLNQKISDLTDPKVIQQLQSEGHTSEANARIAEAEKLQKLKTAQVGEHVYDVTKVLSMHPLIGKETRPFEYHPIEQYGCTLCHGGNGRGLTSENAHGPVFDGDYEIEFVGEKPQFTEPDRDNDPEFSKVFNAKPGHRLLFQTDPILPGALIQAKCMECHQSSEVSLQTAAKTADRVLDKYKDRLSLLKSSLENEKETLLSMLLIRKDVQEKGVSKVVEQLRIEENDYTNPASERAKIGEQIKYLIATVGGENALTTPAAKEKVLNALQKNIEKTLGSKELTSKLEKQLSGKTESVIILDKFLEEEVKKAPPGSIFDKLAAVQLENATAKHIENQEELLKDNLNGSSVVTDVDLLTRNFHRGEQLFISQACYACHRISGLSRGGVGPELTREGEVYPWFVKESIVWPQADLKTSTMPNYRMDHEEIQDLMTFLLSQRDNNPIRNGTAYQNWIQEWEAGKKMPWEAPISPANIHNIRYGMSVFATEGCAACHRLKGFESNVGFKIEKDHKDLSFAQLENERLWFNRLVPEMITGTQLTKVLEENQEEIDRRIVENVRQGSILEEIEAKNPKLLQSFYTPFKYASRAKNKKFADLIDQAVTQTDKQRYQKQYKEWKERVRRVLMVFIQEYGLGRLVGPRPNWSGVYRSDEWLMDHFHQPGAYIARSIMPTFPFDDSKFYALTYMLDVLGIRNRDAARQAWSQNGFDPQLAYNTLCLQCHGDHLQGNGPIAEWIYPIPKNLRNADFLRNYSKENVIAALTHGVKGTPMPPWGEVATDKSTADGIPVLNKNEILQMTEWLFSSLPGSQVIRSIEDVPKWHYEPQDVLDELKREGSELKSNASANSPLGLLNALPKGEHLFAALDPKAMLTTREPSVEGVFEKVPNVFGGGEKYSYFIKKKYYTPQNLEEGQAFFELNCAVCHGKDADGAGIRAGSMIDAKPRMLTNLNWIHSRDDLRLLRSIKYGVPGTAMTPWGDQTTSLQRMQLVMFIRSLSAEQALRAELKTTLFETFTRSQEILEQARIQPSKELLTLKNELDGIKQERKKETEDIQLSVDLYKKQLEVEKQIEDLEKLDQLYRNMSQDIRNQEIQFQNLGANFILKKIDPNLFDQYLNLINLLKPPFKLSQDKLTFNRSDSDLQKAKALKDDMLEEFNRLIAETEKKQAIVSGKIASSQRSEELKELESLLSSYLQNKNGLIAAFEESIRSLNKQTQLFKKIEQENFTQKSEHP